jgi:hypothetical protein
MCNETPVQWEEQAFHFCEALLDNFSVKGGTPIIGNKIPSQREGSSLPTEGIMHRRRAQVQALPRSRSVPQARRPREPVQNHGRACTQVLFLCKAELGFVHFLKIRDGPGGTFHHRISSLLKTGSFRQVRELKIQRKSPGNQVIPKLRKRRHRNPLFGHMGDEISKRRKKKSALGLNEA